MPTIILPQKYLYLLHVNLSVPSYCGQAVNHILALVCPAVANDMLVDMMRAETWKLLV